MGGDKAAYTEGTTEGLTRVLFLHPSDEAYGADYVLLLMVDIVKTMGWEPIVLLPDDVPVGSLTRQLRARNIVIDRIELAPARRRYLTVRHMLAYVRRIRTARNSVRGYAKLHQVQVIHVNTSSLLVGAVIGRLAGVHIVWHIHEIVLRPRLLGLVFRLVPLLAAEKVIAVSDAVRRHLGFGHIARRKVATIHNGIETTAYFAADAGVSALGHPVTAFVGRLNRWKGYQLYVAAVARIASRHPSAAFVLAGDAPAGEEWRVKELERQVAELHMGGRLKLLGYHPDAPALFEASDIVVVPSIWPDPFPTVVLEAMRAGCAVIASRHGGALEMLEHGVSGVLVAPGDVNGLAEAIDTLIGDPLLRARLGAAARERLRTEFNLERFSLQLRDLYEAVIR